MDDKEYLELLDNAYQQLPDVLYKKGRFEIPKVSGKLIKSRTVITNFKEISQNFARDKNHLLKYFLREAGVRGEIDPKENLILHSRFQPAILNKIIENYFTAYVECPNCRSPDTELVNNELKCKACGYVEKLKVL